MQFLSKFLKRINEVLKRANEYRKISHLDELGRRYFVMNSFDGVLTIIGLLLGSFFSNLHNPAILIKMGISMAVAIGISGFWGTYMAEQAERAKSLDELEQATLSNLEDTDIGKASRFAAYTVAVIDGLSPMLATLIVISPFFLAGTTIPVSSAYLISAVLAFGLLIFLGVFLGRISRQNAIVSSMKMVMAGVICGLVAFLLIGNHGLW